MERNSGVKFVEAQVALARQWVSGDSITPQKEVIVSIPQEEGLFPSDKPQATEKVAIPPDDNAARETIDRFERGAEGVRDDSNVSDTVAQHMLEDKTSLEDEIWLGTQEEELYA
jgi:phospholipase D1/2